MATQHYGLIVLGSLLASAGSAQAATNLALHRPVSASSVEAGATLVAANAVDGSASTRWASVEPAPNPEWIYVDLGATTAVSRVVLSWEAAYAKGYQIQTSNDAVNWTPIYTTTTGDGAVDDLSVSGSGRYVRVYATVRGTAYGYSLWELEVYGPAGATPTSTATATATARPRATATSTQTATATATTTSGSGNLALARPAVASSTEGSGFAAAQAVDGSASTRWASVEPAPNAEWIYVDLGANTAVSRVVLKWEAAYAKGYQIQVSSDAASWTPIFTTTTGDGGTDDLPVSGTGRYVRVYATVRGTAYGYSLWELEVYGAGGGPTATATATTGATATRTFTATATKTATATPTRTATPTATSPSTGDGSQWKGHSWNITNGGMAGVALGSPSNVFVDGNGYLHLKITKSGSSATAAEMFSADHMGFGTYQWQIEGPVDNMDKSTVLGLFPYGPADGIGGDGENEIDIEFSKWNNGCGGCNADFTYYPSTGNGGLGSTEDTFNISLGGGTLVTARTEWRANKIVGTIMAGLQPIGTTANILRQFVFTPSDTRKIPQTALPLGMNFWCFEALPATSQEVIIRDFQYVP